MLPKNNRLRKQETVYVLKTSKHVFQTSLFSIRSKKNTQDNSKKYAVVIGKKVSKKAVERNRIKRIIFDALHVDFQELPKATWMVIVVKKKAEGKTRGEIGGEVERILRKLKV